MDRARQPEPLPLDQPVAGRRPRVWCKDCGTALTDSRSRLAGRGPACRAKHGDTTTLRTDGHQVEQDTLPGT